MRGVALAVCWCTLLLALAVPADAATGGAQPNIPTGGATVIKPAQDTSWGGYAGYFADPDGHPWEVVHAPMFPLSADGRLIMPD